MQSPVQHPTKHAAQSGRKRHVPARSGTERQWCRRGVLYPNSTHRERMDPASGSGLNRAIRPTYTTPWDSYTAATPALTRSAKDPSHQIDPMPRPHQRVPKRRLTSHDAIFGPHTRTERKDDGSGGV